ncbi:peroxiredoxin [Mucilaginibacter sp. X4EP1]|uniref:peroxiredoxin n=1 Tax=Mucilaginibacter sp. X4EP1 TaxID=2723092 RepID=UPI0021695DEA|nr:redoxin domain-containing protein [Mucilaginibacter sp. X4EP1]MCS3814326.1 peroxiredoxin Q/BCP [Mucilaginibacter sp. X4EP1]
MNIKSAAAILFSLLLLIGYKSKAQSNEKTLVLGDTMPSFSLTDQNGKVFNSADYTGKQFLVIYFYPKDESMVCTKEACSFRDSFNDFTKAGAIVIGINNGTVASHKEFSDHYKLPFILLSDPGDKVYHLFGVKNKMFMSGRETFIVDLKGRVVFAYEAMMQGKKHADDALAFIKAHSAK